MKISDLVKQPEKARAGRLDCMDKVLFAFSFLFLICGIGAFIAGTVMQEYRRQREVRKGHTTAKVVDLSIQEDKSGSGGPFHHSVYPVLQYYAEGHLCESVYPHGTYPSIWKKGQEVRIDYNTEDPSDYCLSSRDIKANLPMLLSVGGAASVLLGAIMFLRFAIR